MYRERKKKVIIIIITIASRAHIGLISPLNRASKDSMLEIKKSNVYLQNTCLLRVCLHNQSVAMQLSTDYSTIQSDRPTDQTCKNF